MTAKTIDFLVTANRLGDGRVVYLAANERWSEVYDEGLVTRDPAQRDAWLAWGKTRERDVCGVYAIEAPLGAEGRILSARERLRALGAADARRRLGYVG